MPGTRFWFPLTEAAAVSPTPNAYWGHVEGTLVRRRLGVDRDESGLSSNLILFDGDGIDHGSDTNALHRQYVSDTLNAQTIQAQTIKFQFQAFQRTLAGNLFLAWGAYIVDSTGATVKETLVAFHRDNTELADTRVNRSDPQTCNAVTLEQGDRIVVEIGMGGLPDLGGNHDGTIRWGNTVTSTALPEDDTDALSTRHPWMEFQLDTLTFGEPGASASSESSRAMKVLMGVG